MIGRMERQDKGQRCLERGKKGDRKLTNGQGQNLDLRVVRFLL